jgi:uncharacterized membrane protein
VRHLVPPVTPPTIPLAPQVLPVRLDLYQRVRIRVRRRGHGEQASRSGDRMASRLLTGCCQQGSGSLPSYGCQLRLPKRGRSRPCCGIDLDGLERDDTTGCYDRPGSVGYHCAALRTACFTVRMRQARLEPIHAAALVATGSLVIYLPYYLLVYQSRIAQLTLTTFAIHAFFQGVLVTIVALVLYVRAVAVLGASGGAAFGALVPALSALLAIPVLGEWPSGTELVATVLISAGVYLASGAPLRHRRIITC